MWPDARNSFAFLWISLILAPREHSTIVFPLQARDNFLDSIFLTSESPIRQAFVGLSALTGTCFEELRTVTVELAVAVQVTLSLIVRIYKAFLLSSPL